MTTPRGSAAVGFALVVLVGGPAAAADSWGLEHEQAASFEGRVVDLLCELAGDCPPDCGGGDRQLGLVNAEGRLIPVAKGLPMFANAVPDLLPHCGGTVTVDGLLLEHPEMPVFLLQRIRTAADQEWRPAEGFAAEWAAAHGQAEEWFRADPLVKEIVAERGVLGVPGLTPPQ